MSANPEYESYVAAWHELSRHARLHGINLVAVTHADRFGLLHPKEGLSTSILLSALHRATHDIVTDLGGRGHAIPVESSARMEIAKVSDPIIAPKLTPLMKVRFPWALIAFAEESQDEFWRVFYASGPVFNLATLSVYTATLAAGAAADNCRVRPAESLYARMHEAGQNMIDATQMLIVSA